MNERDETLTDKIATIVQTGHRDQKTSHEVAEEVLRLVRDESRPAPLTEEMRALLNVNLLDPEWTKKFDERFPMAAPKTG